MGFLSENPSLTVLVTGANRGIGLEFARLLNMRGHTVIATARDPGEAKDLRSITDDVLQLDQSEGKSVTNLAKKLAGRPIDLLINNAGMGGAPGNIDTVDCDELEVFFRTNAVGPMRVLKALLPNLRASKAKPGATVVNISTIMSSLETTGAEYYGYRASKTGLNMLMRLAAKDLEPDRIMVVNLHPGWVKTRMGGENAAITTMESVTGMLKVIDALTPSMRGGLYDYQGAKIPW